MELRGHSTKKYRMNMIKIDWNICYKEIDIISNKMSSECTFITSECDLAKGHAFLDSITDWIWTWSYLI